MEETKFVAVASGSLICEEDRSPNSTNNLKPEVKNGPYILHIWSLGIPTHPQIFTLHPEASAML